MITMTHLDLFTIFLLANICGYWITQLLEWGEDYIQKKIKKNADTDPSRD